VAKDTPFVRVCAVAPGFSQEVFNRGYGQTTLQVCVALSILLASSIFHLCRCIFGNFHVSGKKLCLMATCIASLAALVRFRFHRIDPFAGVGWKVCSRIAMTLACLGGLASSANAQAPIAFPNTISTVAGGGTTPASGAACAAGSAYTATDAYGDGCPATLVGLGTSQWGIGTDKYGNIFWLDNGNKIVHKIDARSGIMTKVAGGITSYGCTGQTSSYGDNCVAAAKFGGFNARGMTVDPWGNVIIADYGDSLVHIVCNAVSPLCSSAQVGYAELLAGYVNTSGAGAGVAGATAGQAGDGNTAVSSVSTTGINGARGAAADVYGNVYIADTSNGRYRVVLGPASYNGVTNPLTAAIQTDSTYPTAAAGKIYPIEGGFTAVTTGNYCSTGTSTGSGPISLDNYGDGCPFFHTAGSGGTSNLYGVTIDAAGDAIFPDSALKLIRVLYVGGSQMAALIALENPGVTPVIGSVYAIGGHAGTGGSGITATPLLATSEIWNSAPNSITLDSAGNIYVGDIATGEVMFIDINTGYAHVLFTKAGTPCAAKTDTIGDGCPVTQATFGTETYIVPIAIDNLGNLFFADGGSDNRIREVSASSLMPMTVKSNASQTIQIHEPAGVTGITAALAVPSPDVALAVGTCTTNGDTTLDCPITATLNASGPNVRSSALGVTPSGSSTTPTIFPMAGLATGSALVTDGATSTSTGSILPTATLGSLSPLTVAVDGSNNVYSVNNSNLDFSVGLAGSTTATLLSSAAPTGVSQIAADTQGNIYAVGSGASTITKLTVTAAQASSSVPPSYSAGTVSYTPSTLPAKPQGVVVDGNDNIYVSDGTNGAVYKINQSASYLPLQSVASGLSNPTLLALDNSSNLYVYDAGVGKVFKITYLGVQTTVASISATGLATDAAGDLYIQTSSGVSEYPVSGPTTTVYSGGTTPNGIAVDGNGNLYVSDAGKVGILEVLRSAVSYNFGTGSTGSPTLTGTLTNVGNQGASGSNTVTNTTNFAVVAGSSNGCTFSSSILGAQAIGNACTFSSTFVGNGSGTVSDVLTYLPVSTAGSLTMSGTLQGSAIGTTTTISGETPANPSYSPGSTEVTFTVTVTASSGASAPGGTVAVTVDSTTTYPTLLPSGTSGIATVNVSGLTAGSHAISAIYSTNGSFTGSNSGSPTVFSIAQDQTVSSWTPGTTSVQYSSPIGTSALNATATYNSATVQGVFVYTANGVEVNAATYLPIGTFTLAATFYPIDTVDYLPSTVTGGTFTVTKAATTAPVGATQNLVAADGTGNYTTVQAAVNSLTSGGSVYIKPGTYTGDISVTQPNVALRGLGGDPTQVILTHASGAFSTTGGTQYSYAGEFNTSFTNGHQLPAGSTLFNSVANDAGSATLVVARGINTAISSSATTPNNFYGENFTLVNTFDTDNSTTTTTYLSGGVCTANAGPAETYAYLYNSQPALECASQALAIWITSDTAVMNNVYTTSAQDTIYAGAISGSSAFPARQYWFRGKVTGNVDFIFGDAAAVFDHTTIYTTYHSTVTGSETVEAQSKFAQTGGTGDYLSGYVMNSDVFTSQSSGMTGLYFGRPYVASGSTSYSTWILLNSAVDQVNPLGYNGSLDPLPTATYAEYNDQLSTDPATGSADANGVIYLGTGGSSGSGVTGTRETTSTNPGTLEVAVNGFQTNYPSLANTTLSPAEAQQYYPMAFLGATVPTSQYNTVNNWNPTAALAANVNAFVPSGTSASVAVGSSVTILMRPQTPGLGAVAADSYTIPTGTYTLTDNFGGTPVTLASGTLDASGEAYYTSSVLGLGTHNLTWTYSGDSNFAGSTTTSAYVLTVNPVVTTTTLAATVNPIVYGQSASLTATVTPASGSTTPSGTVTLTIDGGATQNATLSGGTASFTIPGLLGGAHSFTASYGGNTNFASSSTSSATSLTVSPAVLTVTGSCSKRIFGQPNSCSASVAGYQYSDGAATVFSGTPTGTTTAARNSPANTYTATPLTSSLALTAFGTANYTISPVNTTFTVSGGAPQSILFAPLPNFAHGASYQLTARTTSGLPVTYSVISGSASVTGSILTVTGTGPVTVQASQSTDPTGDYAAATPVSRSFTAQ
jgi:pectin methylesterase-like acyl-CoA thioesterase